VTGQSFYCSVVSRPKWVSHYTPMLWEIVPFFRTGVPPVSLEGTIEIYAFMEAADESKRRGGSPISVEEVLANNGWDYA
jgi:hypothetical protein